MTLSNLRYVILDCPYDSWNSSDLRELFCEMAGLKFDGYRAGYRDGILSVGDSDLVAIHQLVCREENGKLVPLIGNHTLTVERAQYHNLAFPPLALATTNGQKEHAEVIKSIMDRCAKSGKTLGYDGGWTIHPDVQKDKDTAIELHKHFQAIKVLSLQHYGIEEVLTAATVRFRVEKAMTFFGCKAIEKNGARLADMPVPRFDNEMVVMMHMPKLDAKAIAFAEAYKAMWKNRLVIEQPKDAAKKIAA